MSSNAALRPEWLTDQIWPWPISALVTAQGPLAYTDTGGAGPTVLLVHAGLWSVIWRDVIRDLAGDYRCITIDAPGNGLSPRANVHDVTLEAAADAVAAVVEELDLREFTLVFHDLGGIAALAGVAERPDRVRGLVAVNTFAWTPSSIGLRGALRLMGSAPLRGSDVLLGWMPRMSAGRFGVGRRWDRATKRAYRRGLHRPGRAALHRYFADALRSPAGAIAEGALAALADRPIVTVFGQRNDYFGFQRQWQARFADARRVVVRGGNHFPMCDDPRAVSDAVRTVAAGRR